ncbi:antitoxin Xre/MbcA/ParS toxin-binding domain-containing protein [Kalamiella sp. sgz302252]|uniref:type II RES/Xre toxin-antitoxin system antitoxin n=1 Tax=Pantoea sp. sgz302252 TaxID=3341827 RepID=UPI0036D3CE30
MSFSLYRPQPGGAPASLLLSLRLPETLAEAHRLISRGLDASLVKQMAKELRLDEALLCRMAGIDRNTYSRRLNSASQLFSVEQGGRIYMLGRVLSAANQLFNGNTTRMVEWLNTPAKALGGQKPADMTSTPAGAEAVLNLIGQIEHGVIT